MTDDAKIDGVKAATDATASSGTPPQPRQSHPSLSRPPVTVSMPKEAMPAPAAPRAEEVPSSAGAAAPTPPPIPPAPPAPPAQTPAPPPPPAAPQNLPSPSPSFPPVSSTQPPPNWSPKVVEFESRKITDNPDPDHVPFAPMPGAQSSGSLSAGVVPSIPNVPPPPIPPEAPPIAPPASGLENVGAQAPAPSGFMSRAQKVGADIATILKAVRLPDRRKEIIPEKEQIPEKEAATFDTKLGASVMPKREEAAPPQQTPEKKPEAPASSVSSFHTLKDDLQTVVRDQKMSLVRAVALEEQKRGAAGPEATPQKTKWSHHAWGITFVVIVILSIGGVAAFAAYSILQERKGPNAGGNTASIIFANNTAAYALGNQISPTIKRELEEGRVSLTMPLGAITRIVPTVSETNAEGVTSERPATIEEFLMALETNTPPDLIRALGEDFFFGYHALGENAAVVIIPVSSYERAFAGMLAWEGSINQDLSPPFPPVPSQMIDSSGLLVARTFQDAIVQNYDVRVLRDDLGTTRLLYSFPTRNILVITENSTSFIELLSRLRANSQL